jgi:hypothetical protein
VLDSLNSALKIAELQEIIRIAKISGAAIGDYLKVIDEHFAFKQLIDSQVAQAVAPAKLTARLLLALPLLSVALCESLGMHPLRILLYTNLGWLLLVVCSLLTFGAFASYRKALAKAQVVKPDPGLIYDSVALAVTAGVNSVVAWQMVEPLISDDLPKSLSELWAKSSWVRHELAAKKLQQLAALPIRLLTSLGAYLLPASLLLNLVPTALAALNQSQQ